MSEAWKEFYPKYCVDKPDLNADRVKLVQKSWSKIEECTAPGLKGKEKSYFGERFYQILFEKYPATKALFKDEKSQARALSKMLSVSVKLLSKDLDAVVTQLTNLATRHHKYGTLPAHYGPVGECLVATITEAFAGELDAKVAEAWIHLYSTICTIMIPVTHKLTKEATPAKK
jgi:hemoglobin-like flavoprotein